MRAAGYVTVQPLDYAPRLRAGRVGIAPYIAESGSFHTWLMLQTDHFPEDRRPWTVTPIIRVFKDEYLVEAGVANNGHPLFNLMITF